jgi:hypothetical protein
MKIHPSRTPSKFLALAIMASAAAFAEDTSNKNRTWDNDPQGVQVFILAGQSNMVGHGKAEDGHADVKGAMPLLCYLSAWKRPFRHLFFIPVASLACAIAFTLTKIQPS